MLTIPSISKQYLAVPVAGATNLMPVEIAIVTSVTEEPAAGDWKTAAWDGADAKILIGPGTTLPLPNGLYRVWVRVTATPEIPVLNSGLVRIT